MKNCRLISYLGRELLVEIDEKLDMSELFLLFISSIDMQGILEDFWLISVSSSSSYFLFLKIKLN